MYHSEIPLLLFGLGPSRLLWARRYASHRSLRILLLYFDRNPLLQYRLTHDIFGVRPWGLSQYVVRAPACVSLLVGITMACRAISVTTVALAQ
jgi:hypothetical protein